MNEKRHLLYVEDRESILSHKLLKRTDIVAVVLRFKHHKEMFDQNYLYETEKSFYVFWIDIMVPLKHEAERFKKWQKVNNLAVKYFFNPSEICQYYVQSFARYIKLPSLTEQQTEISKNKILMKVKLFEIGMTIPKYKEVLKVSDIHMAGEEIGWPLVLKPSNESSCRDVYLIKNSNDIPFEYLNTSHEWLVEEFIDYEEYAIDFIVYKGEIVEYFLTKYPLPILQIFEHSGVNINGNITVRKIPKQLEEHINIIGKTYVKGIALDRGYVHMEFFYDSNINELIVGEVGIRIPGSDILTNHELSFGFDIYNSVIDIHLDIDPIFEFNNEKYVGNILLPIKEGIVKNISHLDELLKLEGVIEGKLNYNIGDHIRYGGAAHESSGTLILEGDSLEQVQERMVNILKNFQLETD